MKKIITAFYFLFISINLCNSQKVDTTFFDKNANVTSKEKSFAYLVSKQDINTGISTVNAYRKNGKIVLGGSFKTFDIKNMITDKSGPFYYYKNEKLVKFKLFEPSEHPEVLSSLSKILENIPQQPDSLYLEINYYKNGSIESVGYRCTCCDLIGTWAYYSKDGKYMTLEPYKNNVINGLVKVYYLGKIIETGNYKNDKKDGEWYIYDTNGTLLRVDFYIDGHKIILNN
jgi:antitoxin component YwqK of YwqJK toxin-antitoxin module